MRARIWRWGLSVAAFAWPIAAARAQQLRGEVVLPDGTTRAAGVVVLAIDERGSEAGRALSDDRGEFSVTLPAPGRYALRALQIGYRPTVVAPLRVAAGEVRSIVIVLSAEAIVLAPVRVRGNSSCRIHADSGQLVAQLWEQARAALTATELTASERPIVSTVRRYERLTDPADPLVLAETSTVQRSAETRAFRSEAAELLAQDGYIIDDANRSVYRAPDADALLSDFFVSLHCFHVEPAVAAHPDWIGIGFRAARERRGIREIAGTLWLDRASAELRRLDYHYTNTDFVVARADPGGWVEFLRLSSGHWIVSRWAIRAPRTEGAPKSLLLKFVTGIQIAGGEVLEVSRDSVVLYRAVRRAFEAVLVEREAGLGGEGALVAFAGTTLRGLADSAGRVRVDDALPGRYRAHIVTPAMARLGAMPVERDVEVPEAGGASATTIALPTSWDLLHNLCWWTLTSNAGTFIFGVLRDSAQHPIAGATVSLLWPPVIAPLDPMSIGRGRIPFPDFSPFETRTDAWGRWSLCGVPRGVSIWARVSGDKLPGQIVHLRVPSAWLLARFDLPDTTARRP